MDTAKELPSFGPYRVRWNLPLSLGNRVLCVRAEGAGLDLTIELQPGTPTITEPSSGKSVELSDSRFRSAAFRDGYKALAEAEGLNMIAGELIDPVLAGTDLGAFLLQMARLHDAVATPVYRAVSD